MEELLVFEHDGQKVVDSRVVAERIEMLHKNLLQKIKGYEGILLGSKFSPVDFFIPSNYTDSTGRTLICYLLTKQGCEMVANKLTGKKGVLFTAQYVQAFNAMEERERNRENAELERLKRENELLNDCKNLAEQNIELIKVVKEMTQIISKPEKPTYHNGTPASVPRFKKDQGLEFTKAGDIFIMSLLPEMKRAGIDIDSGELYRWFRENKLLQSKSGRAWNSPRERAIKNGWFVTKLSVVPETGKTKRTAILTEEGYDEFITFFTSDDTVEYWELNKRLPAFEY